MAGSKKGERRGGANPNHIRKTAAPAKVKVPSVARVKRGRGPDKSPIDPGVAKLVNRDKVPAARMERDLDMYFTITGRRERLPRDVMLSAMRYFEENAIDYANVLRQNLLLAGQVDDDDDVSRAAVNTAIAAAEAQVDKYVSMAADVAFKAAPYLHPRLAAMITAQGTDKSAETLFSMLMRDLDEAGKPARYIDHDPDEEKE